MPPRRSPGTSSNRPPAALSLNPLPPVCFHPWEALPGVFTMAAQPCRRRCGTIAALQRDPMPVNRPNWFYGWNVVALTLVCQVLTVGLANFCFALWAVAWQREFGDPLREVMLATTLSLFSSGMLSAFGGKWIDRVAPQKLIGFGAAVFAAALLLIAGATAMWQITAVFTLLIPFGTVFAGPHLCQALVGRWFTRNRGLALGISVLGTSLGGFTLPPLVVRLIGVVGWRGTLALAAGVILLVLIPLALWVLRREPETAPASGPAAPEPAALTTRTLLGSRPFWLVVIAFTPILTAFYAVQANFGTYSEDIGFTQAQAATVISVLSFSMMTGKLLCGRLLDMVDHQLIYFLVVGAFVAGVLGMSLQSGYPLMLLGAVLVGLALGGTLPLMSTKVLDHFGAAAYGRAMGLLYIFVNLSAVGPVAAGWVRDVTGSYPLVFLAFLLPLLPAVILMLAWRPAQHTAAAEANR